MTKGITVNSIEILQRTAGAQDLRRKPRGTPSPAGNGGTLARHRTALSEEVQEANPVQIGHQSVTVKNQNEANRRKPLRRLH